MTAGCDGVTMARFDEHLEGNRHHLAQELKSEPFEPYAVRRVYMLKAQGRYRPWGIPSSRDRMVQEALRMVLEPIDAADVRPYSCGFRPNRRTMEAMKGVLWSTTERKNFFWVIEGDLASSFDTINHRRRIRMLRRRIRDEKPLRFIWKFLRAGVMEQTLFRDTERGTPQGGMASP